ncbi:MAG TPA: acetyl-coenzyme A synthetase N-terminal domain-containing protein, partial [Saprospiraceae bacterium]|nr:acetyl-coenzyme A synthetase N-terminal domain-containing protein [Saprospiraceae bacterium]
MGKYKIKDLEKYFKEYRKSIKDPTGFWEKIAAENFNWHSRWDKVLDFDMKEARFEWFRNAKLNITQNCIDRHLQTQGDKTAIIFEPNDVN